MFKQKHFRVALWPGSIALLFALYISGLSKNPPGFYVDECALAYNAFLVGHTGAGEFGPRFPLYFEVFTNGFTAYVSPVHVYLLAVTFLIFPATILVARVFAALWVFIACVLLGLLASRICSRGVTDARCRLIGLVVAVSALLTPWLFELSRLVLEVNFLPFALVLVLGAIYFAQASGFSRWRHVIAVALSLTLLSYCYTSGRLLGPLLALGMLSFATDKRRCGMIVITGLIYAISLIPILVFNRHHPDALMRRLYEISYIRPGVSWSEITARFISRYLEDQSLSGLLLTGDYHPRHHVQGSGGAVLIATFVLAVIGLLIIIIRRRRERWWWFVVYGLAVSIVPGAITIEPFHALRLAAYPVFLLLLTVPALEFFLGASLPAVKLRSNANAGVQLSRSVRVTILTLLLLATAVQAAYFQAVFRNEGPKREFDFDVPYKFLYDAAVAQPTRPIYLEDGRWGPAYMHGFWYATVDHRPTSEFVHLSSGVKPPSGALVISSEETCQNCEIVQRNGVYLLYRAK
jgi:hypothetical protein